MIDTLQDNSSVVDNSSSASLDELIKNYTMGKQSESEQLVNKEAFAPVAPAQGKGAALLFNTAGNIVEGQNKKARQLEIKKKEMEQRGLEEKVASEMQSQVSEILKSAANPQGGLSYNDAVTKLGSLQVKAEAAGLKQLADVISNVAQKQVLAVAKMKDAEDARISKRQANSYDTPKANAMVQSLFEELKSNGVDTSLISNIQFTPWDGEGSFVDKEKVDAAIDTARVIAYANKEGFKGVAGKSKDEVEKMRTNILALKTKIDNRPKSQRLSDTKAQAAQDIESLVSAGATIQEAYDHVVKNNSKWGFGLFGNTNQQWTLEEVMGGKLAGLQTTESSWQPVRQWWESKKAGKVNSNTNVNTSTKELSATNPKTKEKVYSYDNGKTWGKKR